MARAVTGEKYTPDLETVKRLSRAGNLVPVYREIDADLETPVSAYLKVAQGDYSFLLESVEGAERIARYSFIGTDPYKVIHTGPGQREGDIDPLSLVKEELDRYTQAEVPGMLPFTGGAVGYLGYDAMHHYEDVPTPEKDVLGLPESVWMFADTLLVFDHVKRNIRVVSHAYVPDGDVMDAYRQATDRIELLVERLSKPLNLSDSPLNQPVRSRYDAKSNMTRDYHESMVKRAKEYIYAGDIVQTVLSQRFSKRTEAHPFNIYRALRTVNPSPYMFYMHLGADFYLVGASPEMLVRSEQGHLEYHPLAGTRRRGKDEEEDLALEKELINDEKDRAEHIMLVDLGRNDIGRVSKPGTVRVTQLMDIERFSHVMHIVSHIKGELRENLDNYQALWSCFPAGTVSGAPKLRAMEIIAELEPDKRGPYAGAAGYFSYSGNMDTCITLRTMVMSKGVAHVQAGGGIVADSQPEMEYMETVHKAAALMRAIELAEEKAG